jgi:hypothetical protein
MAVGFLLSLSTCSTGKNFSQNKRGVVYITKTDIDNLRIGMTSEEVVTSFGEALWKNYWGEKADELVLVYQTGSFFNPKKLYLWFGSNDKLNKIQIVIK